MHLPGDFAVLEVQSRPESYPWAKYVWRYPEPANWTRFAGVLLQDIHWNRRIVQRSNVWGGMDETPGSGLIIMCMRLLILENLRKLPPIYNELMVTRIDNLYLCPEPPLRVRSGHIYIPEGEDYWGGVTDRSFTCTFEDAEKALSVLPWLIRHDNASMSNPEQVLGRYFKEQRFTVQRYGRTQVVAIKKGSFTRWRTTHAHEHVPGMCDAPLVLKYPFEYPMVARTCGRQFDTCTNASRIRPWLTRIRGQMALT